MVANQAAASTIHSSQPKPRVLRSPCPTVLMIKPAGSILDVATHGHGARAKTFLAHVVLDRAADGRIEIRCWLPTQVALGRFDRRHANLDVLVVLAVVLTRGHIDDVGPLGVLA